MKIYIAGQYNPRVDDDHLAIREGRLNVNKAIKTFVKLKEKGHIAFVPHLTHFIHVSEYADDYGRWWLDYDFSFLEDWADGIYMLDNWKESEGAKEELEKAKELGLEIFYSMEEVPPPLERSLKVK